MSICSDTTSSSQTVRLTFNIAEERCYLLSTLYQTCQSAAANYVRTAPVTPRARAIPRYHPYATRSSRVSSAAAKKEGKKTATLMDSISRICTQIWRKARRDLVAPHREEADAVREMRDLYKWSEVVARCMESDGLDDGEGEVGSEVSGTEDDGLGFPGMSAAKAAKRICQWLGDEEAWDTCDTVMGELRDLGEGDGVRTPVAGERGGSSEYGSIL
ncbi:uncharacterized protein LY89DRAFT_575666 [Mollisia scopiformis]|uniref:Uncharacterized protein n=1 Tax=Mollisia scopiformis TaxID=149040 RepID=A0A194XQD7_MOLSC|nr:uncharacterized protein LY89DRAFT_575666 [Mollisia scopiformis]KUJ22376.1 hypothetical protein LY89DRAFT_575666 [Mollisia scopiformis]